MPPWLRGGDGTAAQLTVTQHRGHHYQLHYTPGQGIVVLTYTPDIGTKTGSFKDLS